MYRLIFPLLLCAAAASAAPQEPSTSVDIQPLVSDRRANATAQDAVALANGESVRRARQNDFAPEDAEDTTETAQPDTSPRVASTARSFGRARPTQPSARFISKLSYFDKPGAGGDASNFVQVLGKDGRKQFESHCRCEKIWNCPKLQITTPRCPNEYFLCCFT